MIAARALLAVPSRQTLPVLHQMVMHLSRALSKGKPVPKNSGLSRIEFSLSAAQNAAAEVPWCRCVLRQQGRRVEVLAQARDPERGAGRVHTNGQGRRGPGLGG